MADIIIITTRYNSDGLTSVIEDLRHEEKSVIRILKTPEIVTDEIDRDKPDLILFDFDAYPMERFQKAKTSIKEHSKLLPIIGFGERWERRQPHGADYYITYPFTKPQLAEVLTQQTTVKI